MQRENDTHALTRRKTIKLLGFAALTSQTPLGLAVFADRSREIISTKIQNGMRILSERPINAETPPHLLDDEITPASRLFVRNNGLIPASAFKEKYDDWVLTIDGEVERSTKLTIGQMKTRFKTVKRKYVLECGGNGRAAFFPPAKGNQWSYGAVGCVEWEGVLLRDLLKSAGTKPSAVYIGYYGADTHISGDESKTAISRGVPIAKATDSHTMIAFAMNGSRIPPEHGFPLRLVCPGFPASTSGKWLQRIWVRDVVHDGPKMESPSYRIPKFPVAPGEKVQDEDFEIIMQMPVKSLISYPPSHSEYTLKPGQLVELRGFAWTGAQKIDNVYITIDFGRSWQKADLAAPKNRFAWQRWKVKISIPRPGYYEVWSRAQDDTGAMQPMVAEWNPKGYLNNAMPRIALRIKG